MTSSSHPSLDSSSSLHDVRAQYDQQDSSASVNMLRRKSLSRSKLVMKDDHRMVHFNGEITRIIRMDTVMQTAELDMVLYLRWYDPTMVGNVNFGRTVAEYEQLWNPLIEVNNAISCTESWSKDTAWNFKDSTNGLMMYSMKYRVVVENPMDLRAFPFDTDTVEVCIGSQQYNSDRLTFEYKDSDRARSEVQNSLAEFTVGECTVFASESNIGGGGKGFSHINMHLTVARKSDFYLKKMVTLHVLVSVWSWVVFWSDPLDMLERMRTVLALFVASLAFMFVTAAQVPKVPYLTRFDTWTLLSFFELFMVAFESWLAHLIASPRYFNDVHSAERMDAIAQIVFAVALVVRATWFLRGLCTG